MSGGKPPDQTDPESLKDQNQLPGQISGNSAWAGSGVSGGMNCSRTFQQIIEDEKKKRNILEIKLQKLKLISDSDDSYARSLTYDDLGELIFDVLKIDPEDCVAFDYNTGRYDVKQIQLKPDVYADKFATGSPIEFKNHLVHVYKQLSNITRVTFKNVPLNVPDEEILHLCKFYGTPFDNTVRTEVLTNERNRGMKGSTRFVDMELNKGRCMMNYYWMEGPLQGDQGRRILVLHNGQTAQCSHCLRIAGSGCSAGGNGKACKLLNNPRGKMLEYMQHLRAGIGYVSLKTTYKEYMAKNFPSLIGFDADLPNNMEGVYEDCDNVSNVADEKDRQINHLKTKVQESETLNSELNDLKFELANVKAELVTHKKKLPFTQISTEQRLLDSISNPEGFNPDPLLIGVYSATLDEEEFSFNELDEESTDKKENQRSRKEIFLSSIEKRLDPQNKEHTDCFNEIKNQILEKVKATQQSRIRARSMSSSSRKRVASGEADTSAANSPVRQKISGIPTKKI